MRFHASILCPIAFLVTHPGSFLPSHVTLQKFIHIPLSYYLVKNKSSICTFLSAGLRSCSLFFFFHSIMMASHFDASALEDMLYPLKAWHLGILSTAWERHGSKAAAHYAVDLLASAQLPETPAITETQLQNIFVKIQRLAPTLLPDREESSLESCCIKSTATHCSCGALLHQGEWKPAKAFHHVRGFIDVHYCVARCSVCAKAYSNIWSYLSTSPSSVRLEEIPSNVHWFQINSSPERTKSDQSSVFSFLLVAVHCVQRLYTSFV